MRVFAYYYMYYTIFRVLTVDRCPIETDRDRCFLFSSEVAAAIRTPQRVSYNCSSSTTLNIYI